MKLSFERKIPLVFSLAILLIMVIVFFAFRSMTAVGNALVWRSHTQDVLIQLDEILISTINAESNGRGYLITRDEYFLEPFYQSQTITADNLSKLRDFISDNPPQIERISRLENAMNERMEVLNRGVELRRTKSLEDVLKENITGRGREKMANVRTLIDELKTEERTLLTKRESDLNKSRQTTYTLILVAGIAAILSLGFANLAIYREIKKRRTAEDDLRHANTDLEKRVEERTEEISRKNDELKEQIRQRETSESRHRLALEAGNLGTWLLNPHTNTTEVDERGLSLFGFSADDFEGNAFGRVYEEDAPRVKELFQNSINNNKFFNAEFRILTKDGKVRWNNCIGQPVLDESGKIAHVVGNCRDVTDLKENENLIRQSEIFRRAILDSLSAHIAVLDKSGEIVAVNRAWERFAEDNCSKEKIQRTGIGQNYLTVCENSDEFDEDTKKICDNLRAVLEGKSEGFSYEYPCHSPKVERWFLLQVTSMKSEKGGAVVSHIDISDRKNAEAELRNSEEFTRSIFENSPDCVKVLELDGTLNSINKNGLQIMEIEGFEYSKGKKWTDSWEDDEGEMAYQAVKSAREGKSARFEGFRRTVKGTPKYWDVLVSPVFDAERNPVRLIATMRDITERRQIERERETLLESEQAARKEAEIANRLRDEFLATVSHELRAPLNSILGWGKLLIKGNLDEPTSAKAIQTIVRNAEAQNRLIEDLLDVSRIISGKLRLEVITIQPMIFVESALETVLPAAEAKNITLEVKQDSVISHISGDPNRLQQVIWNLLSNAIKFTPNGGKVTVEIERQNGYTEIRVRDTGIGISPEFLPHVFDRFRQADASSIRKFGGLGLGLAIVRHIVEMHGGTVSVASEGENLGTTFTVSLPVTSMPKEFEETKSISNGSVISNPPDLQLDGLLILVVDDEEDTRQMLVQSLTYYGATVITAKSAAEGLEELQSKNPDVLVSDIGMPGEDGYSLIRKIRTLENEHHKNTVAIALTAFSRAQDRMRALACGFQNHVGKPVELDELATVIASLTGRLQAE